MEKVTSADGTAIAYERYGSGQPVILVGGALCDRAAYVELAKALAADFTAVTYDRRGRGDSGNTTPYAVAREVEDIGALVTALGGVAAIYGHSSGAALVAEAASSGLPFTKVVLHEPPYGPDDEEAQRESDEGGEAVMRLLAEGCRRQAVETFLQLAGMPEDAAKQWAGEPGMDELAPTLEYDFAVVGNTTKGGTVPFGLLAKVTQPTLALCGTASPEFMIDAARVVAKTLPGGRCQELEGQDHVVPTDVLAPVLRNFLTV